MIDPNQKSKGYSLVSAFRNLSVPRKLSVIIFMFAFFLIVLAVVNVVALEILSGFRTYVGGEGLYSKNQKDAVYYLVKYADSHNEEEYEKFLEVIKVPLACRKARLELEKPDADLEIASRALIEGRNHPEDVRATIHIFRTLRNIGYIDKITGIWAEGDDYIVKLTELGDELHNVISGGQATEEKLQSILDEIDVTNKKLMSLEDEYSATFGKAARQTKRFLVCFILLIFVLSLTTGVLISLLISTDIKKKIILLKKGAARIAETGYEAKIGMESKDEFGELGMAFDDMSQRLLETKISLEKKNKELLIAQEEMKKACDSALAATRLKSAFLANMSHEIRTPMNAVIGFSNMLLDTDLDENQIDYAKTIIASGEALLSLIDDILDFSKIEAGALDFEQTDFDPELLAYEVCDIIRPRIESKPIEILCHTGDNLPSLVRGDPGRFRQVLLNLMSNASKFTESGEIELVLDKEEERDKKIKLHTTVRDTGIGIPKDMLSVIFKPFLQIDGSDTRRHGGVGLGLAICKQMSNLANGDIWAESEVEKGSTFHATAWFGKVEEKETKRIIPVSLSNKKALIVDDNRRNLDILTHILELIEMRVAALESGEEALPALQRALENNDPFDLCVLDIHMPGMSGYEAAEQIRNSKTGKEISDIPLIALSSLMERDARKCEDAGFNGFLSKPVHREKLYRILERMMGKTDGGGEEDKAAKQKIITQYSVREEMKRSVRILLAEDNLVNQKLARMMLTKAGYQVEVAGNGRKAFEKYTVSPASFDLILMDIEMPEMDGIDATHAIRRFEGQLLTGDKLTGKTLPVKRHVPIIAMTAHAMRGDREKCLAAGMDDYVSKPIKRETVFKVIEKWIFNVK